MYHNSLNQDSLTKINNIVRGFKAIPMYLKYEINSYLYDAKGGVHAIMLLSNNSPVSLFLFYPGSEGEINSIAIYGASLEGHLRAIKSSMTIFGLLVESVEMDYGIEPFVDVYLKKY